MRAVVVFNPAARGNRAQRGLDALRKHVEAEALRPTHAPGEASALAAEACRRGLDVMIAAGGDGTVSEVVDGMAAVPGSLEAVQLGVIPLGTINVFARELGLPHRVERAWHTIEQRRELRVDLPQIETGTGNAQHRRCFVQLAGCGLDSRAIAAVNLAWKKRVGPVVYVLAVLQAMRGHQPRIRLEGGARSLEGELVLLGNGRFYAGEVAAFPHASLQDGLLEARVFERVTLMTLCRFGLAWIGRRPLSQSVAAALRSDHFELTGTEPIPVEADGDNIGVLPARFTVRRQALRVIVP